MSFKEVRLFRDAAVADAPAAIDPISIMAKSARLIQPDDPETAIPVINLSNQTANAPAQQPPTETGNGSAPAEQKPANVQDTKPVDLKPASAPANQPPAPQVQTDWKEVLKQQPDTEVLKALGLDPSVVDFVTRHKQLDPKIAKLVDHWQAKGNVQDYLEALSTDYAKMSDEDVMKRQLHQEIKDMGLELSRDEFEDLYRTRVTEQYKLDPDMFAEKDTKIGRLTLKMDAAKARNGFAAKQQEFLLAPPPENQPSEFEQQHNQREQAAQEAVTEYINFMSNAPEVRDLVQTKILKIGEGDQAFNYEVQNPVETLDLLFDIKKFDSKLRDDKGNWDTKKHELLAVFMDDMYGFLSKHAAHYQEIGKQKAIEPLENASLPAGTATSKGPEILDPAAAMARNGVVVSG